MDIHQVRYFGGRFPLRNWKFYSIKGDDCLSFLQGQTTNDVIKLSVGESQLNTRLTRQGRVLSYFFLGKTPENIFLLVPEILANRTIEDLQKFIIMEDVKIEEVPLESSWVLLSPSLSDLIAGLDEKNYFKINIFGEDGVFLWNDDINKKSSLPVIEDSTLRALKTLSGFPEWGEEIKEDMLLNETFLNELAISYSKGCFLGQETVSKIQNNRGAAKFPCLLKISEFATMDLKGLIGQKFLIEGKNIGQCLSYCEYQGALFIQISLPRALRVSNQSLTFLVDGIEVSGTVLNLPFFQDNSRLDKSRNLYKEAISLFQKDNEEEAKNLLAEVIKIDPEFADAYESLGVIFGRHENYLRGIELMDDLLKVDPESIMAHTNKSLYLMKLGKIEEAEKEKDLATVKSFKKAGNDAKNKKLEAELKKQKVEELKKREDMFLQVLELDRLDLIANFGMADISFYRSEYEKALDYLNKVIEHNPKYSNAYLLLGKTYEGMNKGSEAMEIYKKGIPVASLNGDMMPANEMQGRLLALK